MDISFELYKIFYHVAISKSFSEAAHKLYISQSAVSQSVKNLEEKIDTPLFIRQSRSVRLTLEGELLFKHVEQAYNFIKTAENKILEMQNLLSGEIRIGVSDTICKYYLIPYLKRFSQLYPKIKIQVTNRTSSQIIDILKNGLIDLGLVTLPVSDKSLLVRDFLTVQDIFVASEKFESLKDRTVSLHELKDYPLLLLPKNSATRQNLDRFLRQIDVEVTPEIELESIDLLVEFARIGIGVANVLKESATVAIQKGELFEVHTVEELPMRKLGIITMQDVPSSRASEEFVGLHNQTPS